MPCFDRGVPVWSTDLRHLPPTSRSGPGHERGVFVRAIVEAATSRLGEPRWCTVIRCLGSEGGTKCDGRIEVSYDGADSIEWSCRAGCGESGRVTGFVGSEHDLSLFVTMGPEITWCLAEDEHEALLTALRGLPELRGTITRAEPTGIANQVKVKATVEELEDLSAAIENLTVTTRSHVKREVVRRSLRSLSAALGGSTAN